MLCEPRLSSPVTSRFRPSIFLTSIICWRCGSFLQYLRYISGISPVLCFKVIGPNSKLGDGIKIGIVAAAMLPVSSASAPFTMKPLADSRCARMERVPGSNHRDERFLFMQRLATETLKQELCGRTRRR
jgi:hypothetical protein